MTTKVRSDRRISAISAKEQLEFTGIGVDFAEWFVWWNIDFLEDIDDAGTSFDGFVEFEMEMGSKFEDDPLGEKMLQAFPFGVEFCESFPRLFWVTHDTDEDMGIF